MQIRYDLTGSQVHQAREYDISPETNIKFGQLVKITDGLIVSAIAAETSAITGIAAEEHTGVASDLSTRSNGKKIIVFDSPTIVCGCSVPVITATSGSTSTIVDSSLAAAFVDDEFNGGYVKLIGKGVNSTNSDSIGAVRRIADYTATGKIITLEGTLTSAISAGDKYEIYPPIGFAKGNLNTNKTGIVLTATASLPIKVVGRSEEQSEILFMAALHELGNKKA